MCSPGLLFLSGGAGAGVRASLMLLSLTVLSWTPAANSTAWASEDSGKGPCSSTRGVRPLFSTRLGLERLRAPRFSGRCVCAGVDVCGTGCSESAAESGVGLVGGCSWEDLASDRVFLEARRRSIPIRFLFSRASGDMLTRGPREAPLDPPPTSELKAVVTWWRTSNCLNRPRRVVNKIQRK